LDTGKTPNAKVKDENARSRFCKSLTQEKAEDRERVGEETISVAIERRVPGADEAVERKAAVKKKAVRARAEPAVTSSLEESARERSEAVQASQVSK
jgi:hypothetical protein